jgi:CspA family cold shock protein
MQLRPGYNCRALFKGGKMHKGKIKKLIRDRGFGFISDTDGREVFFHQSGLVGITFDALKGTEDVEFDVEKSDKGPRAVNINIAKEDAAGE